MSLKLIKVGCLQGFVQPNTQEYKHAHVQIYAYVIDEWPQTTYVSVVPASVPTGPFLKFYPFYVVPRGRRERAHDRLDRLYLPAHLTLFPFDRDLLNGSEVS